MLVWSIFTAVGCLWISTTAVRLLAFVSIYYKPSTLHKYQRPEAWAMVTGSSDGIGRALALRLAAKGLNVIIHGRNPEKLAAVRDDLEQAFPQRSFRSIVANAAESHGMKSSVKAMAAAVEQLPGPLTLLVNNVGGTTVQPRRYMTFESLSSDQIDGLLNLNGRFTVKLTHALLPLLSRDGPGCVVNISSSAGDVPAAYCTVYSGAKSMILSWSQGLYKELKLLATTTKPGIELLTMSVGRVTRVSHNKDAANLFMPSAGDMADAVIARIGCGRAAVSPYWPHACLEYMMRVMPEPVAIWILNRVMQNLKEEEDKTL